VKEDNKKTAKSKVDWDPLRWEAFAESVKVKVVGVRGDNKNRTKARVVLKRRSSYTEGQ